jgi:hypothetical protein
MAHNHGKEYQIRLVHADGTEALSGWLQSEAQVAPTLAASHRPPGTAYWLRARTVVCPDCRVRDQGLWECPLTGIPSSRYRPHDSGYLRAAGRRDRSEVPQPRRTESFQAASRLRAQDSFSCPLPYMKEEVQSCTENIFGF